MNYDEPIEEHLQSECPMHTLQDMEPPEGRMYFGGVTTMSCSHCGLTMEVRFNCGTYEALTGQRDEYEEEEEYE